MKKQKQRCTWVNTTNPIYVAYHDNEWGKPVHEDKRHFEMLTLEGAQAGLSWETILKKRMNYRRCFAHFDPKKVAKFTPKQIEQLLQEPGIVRNRLKIESTVSNARAFLKVQKEFGSFNKYIWQFVGNKPIINTFKDIKEYPSKTPLSDTISKDLKKRGFRFVGSTIIYAYMQAIGLVNDHQQHCYKKPKSAQNWYLYVIRCQDNSLYTGITTNVEKRLNAHLSKKSGAKYLRGKGELKVIYHEKVTDKSTALKLERKFKALPKVEKEAFIKNKGSLCRLI